MKIPCIKSLHSCKQSRKKNMKEFEMSMYTVTEYSRLIDILLLSITFVE